jgi:M6 family metalloprotease-like protein
MISARTAPQRGRAQLRGRRFAAAALVLVAAAVAAVPAAAADHPLLQPVDKQVWKIHSQQTWADYKQVRPDAWNSPLTSQGSQIQYKGAVILLDFNDQPFLITQPVGSHRFGNPLPGLGAPVARDDVDDWMLQFLNFPNQFNNGQGIHAYWMEDSYGKIGVDLQTFGPYRLSGKYHEYGGLSSTFCPAGDTCNRDFTNEGTNLWRAATGCATGNCGFDFRFLVTAGHDETSTWHEFGEMMFETRDDIPASFGPPGAANGPVLNAAGNPIPNWSTTRYVPWTSWLAAANHWPSAGGGVSRQAENSGIGVYAHEFSHIRGLPDNYGNPYDNSGRMPTAHWEMMSRGSFNGPGGVHTRWQVPNAGGSALGPHHMVRFKQMLNIYDPQDQVMLERNNLPTDGVAVTTLKAREYAPNGDKVALMVNFGTGGDLAGSCATQGFTGPNDEYPVGAGWCPGTNFNHYTMEVVDTVGNDSFAPGHGVLIAKTKNTGSPRVWMIDANTHNINMIDFYKPSGVPVPMTRFDPRQLNDGSFHAGTNSGSKFEHVDAPNRLHPTCSTRGATRTASSSTTSPCGTSTGPARSPATCRWARRRGCRPIS